MQVLEIKKGYSMLKYIAAFTTTALIVLVDGPAIQTGQTTVYYAGDDGIKRG